MTKNRYRSWLASAMLIVFVFGCSTTGVSNAERMKSLGSAKPPTKQGEAYGRFLRSLVEERNGQFDAALRSMEEASQLDPDSITPMLHLIRGYMRQENFDKGQNVVERMLELHPDNANLWALLGRIYYKQDMFDEAMSAFNKSIELEPKNLVNLSALIELQETTNSLVDSIDIFERLIKRNPDSSRLYFQLGLNLTRIEDTEGARDALEKAIALNPNLARAYYLLALIYLESDENEKAVAFLKEYIERRKDSYKAYEYLLGGLTRLGQYAEALEVIEHAMKTPFVNTTAHLETVYVLLLQGENLEKAESMIPPSGAPFFGQLFTAVIRKEKGEPYLPLIQSLDEVEGDLDSECSKYIGEMLYLFTYEGFGNWFVEQLNAFRGETESRSLDFMLARTLLSMEKTQESVAVMEAMLDKHGPDMHVYYYLASAYEELDDFDNTEKNLKAYLELEPNDPDILNFLGYLYAEHGTNLEEAEKLLNKALEIDPENPYYMDSLGWLYFQQGKPKEALEFIQKAVYGMESEDAILRDHLGDVYLKLGDRKKAVREWERSFRLDPSQVQVQGKIEKYRK